MSLSFNDLKKEIKPGDIYSSIEFGSSIYIIISVNDRSDDSFSFYGVKWSRFGERWRSLFEQGIFTEKKNLIAPSPFNIHDDSKIHTSIIQEIFKKETVVK